MANATSTPDDSGTLVTWEEGIGDDKKYHIAHVSEAGVTLLLKTKDHANWEGIVESATDSPDEAAAILQKLPRTVVFAAGEIAKATYAEQLNQLTLFNQDL